MKKTILLFAFASSSISYSQVGIGTSNPDPSAKLHIESTTSGLLLPRLTENQKAAIINPAVGLMIYQTNENSGFYFFNGLQWQKIEGITGANGADGISAYQIWLDAGNTGTQADFLAALAVTTTYTAGNGLALNGTAFNVDTTNATANQVLTTDGSGSVTWANAQTDNLGNHTLSQDLNLNGEPITDNTDSTSELTIQSLIDNKEVHIKSYDEIYITTIDGAGGNDPAGNAYSTYGDIELTSAGGIIIEASEEVLIESGTGEDIDIISGDDIVIEANDVITIMNGNNIILDSGNDIELNVTSGDFVEIWEDGIFLYTLHGSRGSVGQFMQRSSDGSTEYYSDWSAYTLPTSDGTAGQTLKTDGSGAVTWQDAILKTTEANRDVLTPSAGDAVWCSNFGTNGQMQVYNGTNWTDFMGNQAASAPPQIGDTYQGGIVGYIFQSGDSDYVAGEVHGIIISSTPIQSITCVGNTPGRGTMQSQTAITNTAIGSGEQNTLNLYNAGHTSSSNAIGAVYNYTDGTYSDWFLPSKDELYNILTNLAYGPAQNIFGLGSSNIRTSSEVQNDLGKSYAYSFNSTGVIYESLQNDGGCAYALACRKF